MKIRFMRRISGYAKVAYIKEELEVSSYKILLPGTSRILPNGEKHTMFCTGLQVDGKGVFELKPGSKVVELNS